MAAGAQEGLPAGGYTLGLVREACPIAPVRWILMSRYGPWFEGIYCHGVEAEKGRERERVEK